MAATIERKLSRQAKREAIADLSALGWADDRIALAVGVTDRTVREWRSQLAEKARRIRRMKAAREELGGRPILGE